MKDRLPELGAKYGDYTKIPLKSTEVAPGVSKSASALEPRPISKLVDKRSMYRGMDGNGYFFAEDLIAANDAWKQQNYRKIEDIKRI